MLGTSGLRGGVLRINIGAGRLTEPTGDDLTEKDSVLSHPVYGVQGCVCIVQPGPRTAEHVRTSLRDAHTPLPRGAGPGGTADRNCRLMFDGPLRSRGNPFRGRSGCPRQAADRRTPRSHCRGRGRAPPGGARSGKAADAMASRMSQGPPAQSQCSPTAKGEQESTEHRANRC